MRQIEAVQRRATKQIPEMKNMEYADRLKKLKLPTLLYRRMRGDMIETYKILTEKYDPDVSNFLPLHREKRPTSTSRGNSLKIMKRLSKKDLRKYTFSNRIADWWNGLPEEVVAAPSLNAFKNRLDKFWDNLTVKYDFETALNNTRPLNAPGGRD